MIRLGKLYLINFNSDHFIMHTFCTRYKCPKEKHGIGVINTACNWRGVLSEFVLHMKQEHPDSFYEIHQQGLFRWKLPLKGDQRDYGIIKQDLDYYLFEMSYNDVTHRLYFCLEKISETNNCTQSCVYEFKIGCFDNRKEIQKQMKMNVAEIYMPIEQRSNTISLSKSNLNNFLNQYGHFTWALQIVCNDA